MTSQHDIWDARYRDRNAPSDRIQQNDLEFAQRVAGLLAGPSDVLELGCGPGLDAAYLAGQGDRVTATDFSDAAVRTDAERFAGEANLRFRVLDMARPFDLPDAAYDLVYARLSLHYFSDAVMRRIFEDMARVLRPGGLLAFMCKSTADPLYGKGAELEPDMFESGHQRHFFSEAYARDLLSRRFEVQSLTAREGALYGQPSAWLEVVAKLR